MVMFSHSRPQPWAAMAIAAAAIILPHTEAKGSGQGPTCQEVNIPVSITANNTKLPNGLEFSDPISFVNAAASELLVAPISGTYNIAGRYCEPEVTVPGL